MAVSYCITWENGISFCMSALDERWRNTGIWESPEPAKLSLITATNTDLTVECFYQQMCGVIAVYANLGPDEGFPLYESMLSGDIQEEYWSHLSRAIRNMLDELDKQWWCFNPDP